MSSQGIDGSSLRCSQQPQTGSDRPQAVHAQPDPHTGSVREAHPNQNSGVVLPIRLYTDHTTFLTINLGFVFLCTCAPKEKERTVTFFIVLAL